MLTIKQEAYHNLPKPPRITIKAESYSNLPNKFRRQHGKFDITNPGMGGAVASSVVLPFYFDLLKAMGVLDDGNEIDMRRYARMQMAALDPVAEQLTNWDKFLKKDQDDGNQGFEADIDLDPDALIDGYRYLCRKIPTTTSKLIDLACHEILPGEDTGYNSSLRMGLTAISEQILRAFEILNMRLGEIDACK